MIGLFFVISGKQRALGIWLANFGFFNGLLLDIRKKEG